MHQLVISGLCLLIFCGCGEEGSVDALAHKYSTSSLNSSISSNRNVYIEKDGIVIVELESTNFSGSDWVLREDESAVGGRAIEWLGGDLFNQPGKGLIEVKIHIKSPGTYLFSWANKIGFGDSTTEANDSWLKIEADKFYAVKGTSVICPKGLDASNNSCVGGEAEGAGKDGWFKVYRYGGPVDEYKWLASTSDKDPHAIYADFSKVGIYTIRISGRSKHNIIDRFILVKKGRDAVKARLLPESSSTRTH